MQRFEVWLAPALAILGIILAIAIGNNLEWVDIPYRANLEQEALKVATSLFVVALFLERATAVLNDILFEQDNVAIRSQLRLAALATGDEAKQRFATARWEGDLLEEKKQRLRLGVGFLAAVLTAGAGLRTLSGLLNVPTMSNNQQILLDTMDIFLTAGLLAGGSNAIAAIIAALKKPMEAGTDERLADYAGVRGPGYGGSLAARMRRAGFAIPAEPVPAPRPLPALTAGASYPEPEADDEAANREWRAIHGAAAAALSASATRWRTAKALERLRGQLNAAYPSRSTASDGTIGDAAHCANGGTSDHCPNIKDGAYGVVTAFDATHDPANGCDMAAVTQAIVDARDARIKYIIWNSRICASYPAGGKPAWTWRPYSGDNPHDKHAHFSVLADKPSYDSEADWTIA